MDNLFKYLLSAIIIICGIFFADADNQSSAFYNALKKYDSIGKTSNYGATVEKNNKWGFVNSQGQEIVPCLYDKIEDFNNDVARVKRNNKWGLVNSNGTEIVHCNYDYVNPINDEIAIVRNDGKLGIANFLGQETIPCKYDNITSFINNLFQVNNNGKIGLFNSLGEEIIPCKYDAFIFFENCSAAVMKNGKWGFSNNDNKDINFSYNYVEKVSTKFAKVKKDNMFGIVNANGQEVLPCKYDLITDYKKGHAIIRRNKKYGLINQQGEIIIPCMYEAIETFKNDLLKVKYNDKYGLITTLGEEVLPLSYERNLFYGIWKLEQNHSDLTLTINNDSIIELKRNNGQDEMPVCSSYELYTNNGYHYIKTKTSTYRIDTDGIYDLNGKKFIKHDFDKFKDYDYQNSEMYTVKDSETLEDVARMYGMTVEDLILLNELKSDVVKPGKILFVFRDIKRDKKHQFADVQQSKELAEIMKREEEAAEKRRKLEAEKKRKLEAEKKRREEVEVAKKKRKLEAEKKRKEEEERKRREDEQPIKHTVKEGQNLDKIARLYGVSIDDIKRANGLKNDNIIIGSNIVIPTGGKTASAPQQGKQQVQQPNQQGEQQVQQRETELAAAKAKQEEAEKQKQESEREKARKLILGKWRYQDKKSDYSLILDIDKDSLTMIEGNERQTLDYKIEWVDYPGGRDYFIKFDIYQLRFDAQGVYGNENKPLEKVTSTSTTTRKRNLTQKGHHRTRSSKSSIVHPIVLDAYLKHHLEGNMIINRKTKNFITLDFTCDYGTICHITYNYPGGNNGAGSSFPMELRDFNQQKSTITFFGKDDEGNDFILELKYDKQGNFIGTATVGNITGLKVELKAKCKH